MENSLLSTIKNGVYKVYTSGGTGTAFYVQQNDCFVTNYHVVAGYRDVALENSQLYRYKASVILVDPANDIAILKCADAPKVSFINLNPSLQVMEGERVTVLGFPYGPFSVTDGIISNKSRIVNNKNFIQTDAAINPGNSGGPIVNNSGELVAIASSKLNESDCTGFGIPLQVLLQVLPKLSAENENVYSVACESCGNLLQQAQSYCPSCGASLNSSYFTQQQPERFAPLIEGAISEAGIDPVLARTGKLYWEFHNGSSLIRIFIYKDSYIFATSPLNTLGGNKLEALYRYVASNATAPYGMGIYQNNIFLSHRFAIADLYSVMQPTVLKNLTTFIHRADDTDNFIEETFGCPKTIFSRA